MKTVLAVAYGGGHIACLLPVIEHLRGCGVRVQVLALTTAADVCARRGVPFLGFKDFPALQDERSRTHGARLSALHPPHPAVTLDESIAYLGASYRDLEETFGITGASERFERDGRQAFLPVASLRTIINELAPDVVLATSAPRAEWAAVIAARQAGIPTVVVVDLFGLSEKDRLRDPSYGDIICVISESVREGLVAEGRAADSIRVTGNPVFDRLADPELRERGLAFRRQRGWDASCRVITWASQPEPSDPQLPRRIEAALLSALADHLDWYLVLRPHPSDVYTLPPSGPQVTHSTRADDLHTLLAASDVVVTMTSTVGLEAAFIGIPLVTWDLSENTRSCPYAKMGISEGVVSFSELAPAIMRALAGQGPRPRLPQVGSAARLVAETLQEFLK